MRKGQLIRIGVAGLLAISMMGAEDPACEERRKDPSGRSNQDVSDLKKKYLKTRKVVISTHGDGPYVVIRVATGPDRNGNPVTERQVRHIAHGTYEGGYEYTTGTSLHVKVEVQGNGRDTFDCEVTDAGAPKNRSYDRGKGGAYCEIVTQG